MGDLAFSTVGMDIETAVWAHILIITVVLNNSTMGIYADSRFPVVVDEYQLKTLSGNFAEVSRALGAHSEQAVTPDEIVPAFRRALEANSAGKPAVLEVLTKEEGVFSNCTLRPS